MKLLKLFTIFLLLARPIVSFAQFTLTIEIKDLRNNNGQLLLQLYDGNEKIVREVFGRISYKKCLINIDNLKPGRYGFKYFHDENNNANLETNWLGIPVEGYGFSNNALGNFGPPPFEKWIFDLRGSKKIICAPNY